MMVNTTATLAPPTPWWFRVVVLLMPILLAWFSAKSQAGGWNDGSRFAAIEAIADHGTLQIDQSIFVQVPDELILQGNAPYDPKQPLLLKYGTFDKLLIDGHFYSDKPYLVSLIYAGVYRVTQWCGGGTFRDDPLRTIWLINFLSSGCWYVIAVWCWVAISARRGWPFKVRCLLLVGFSFGSVAVPYVQTINAHEIYLGTFAAIWLFWEIIRGRIAQGLQTTWPVLTLGTLGGWAYHLDPGLAPGLVLAVCGAVAVRVRTRRAVLQVMLAALPWVVAYHGINYALGGPLLKPLNSVPAFFNYPNSPFNAANITGFWQHASIIKFLLYLPDLLVGKQGFLTHNLPLMSVVVAVPYLVRHGHFTREHAAGGIFVLCGYLSYAILSKNHGGACCSVRWFVPFLTVGFVMVGDYLTWQPERFREQIILTFGGLTMAISMMYAGPWTLRMVPGFWAILGSTLGAVVLSRFLKPASTS